MIDLQHFTSLLVENFTQNNLEKYLEPGIIETFYNLTEIMLETNAHMNITALTTLEKIIPLHYADCIKIADWIPEGRSVLDVGCGGGFPILPLAIVRPDLHLTGLDSTDKKVRYVQATADQLGLRIHTLSGRAEELAKDPQYREHYDLVISRAVARLHILNELCIPFVKPGGTFLALKGAAGMEEYHEAKPGMRLLGCGSDNPRSYSIRTLDGEEKRIAVIAPKEKETPATYPRQFGAIKKKPL